MQVQASRVKQVMRFCIAGAVGVVVYYATLYGLTEYFGVWYITSAVIGFILNTGSSFALQKFWTFENKEVHMINRQIVLYIITSIFFLIGNTAFLYLMVQYLHVWYIAAQIILTVIISMLSFFISKKIFKPS